MVSQPNALGASASDGVIHIEVQFYEIAPSNLDDDCFVAIVFGTSAGRPVFSVECECRYQEEGYNKVEPVTP